MLTKEIIRQVHTEMLPFTSAWGRFRFIARIALFHITEEEDLAVLDKYLQENLSEYKEEAIAKDVQYFRDWFKEWPNPELPQKVRIECPVTTAKLDTAQKVRALLCCSQAAAISVEHICSAAEEILRPHEIDGATEVSIEYLSPYTIERKWRPFTDFWYRSGALERLAGYTQREYEDFRTVLGIHRADRKSVRAYILYWSKADWVATWRWYPVS